MSGRISMLLCIIIVSGGCGGASDEDPPSNDRMAKPNDATSRYIWEREERPYKITHFQEKNYCSIGIVLRSASVVYPDPPSKDELESAVKEVYGEFRREIEGSCPQSESKRINIRFYFDEREESLLHIVCHAVSGTGPELPKWPPTELTWKWRNKAIAPTAREREIYFDYMERLAAANERAWEPYENSGKLTKAMQFEVARRERDEKSAAKQQLCRDWNITPSELDQIYWRNYYWADGFDFTPAELDEAVRKAIE